MKKMHGISTKAFAALLAVTLLVGSAIGGTLAWLTSKSDSLVNTFTIGNVAITLEETKGEGSGTEKNFKVTPGVNIEKDPKVTVDSTSEDCWLFVKITEDGNAWNNGLSYTPASGWTPLTSEAGVYYRDVASNSTQNQDFYVLAGDDKHPNGIVKVDEDITSLDANTKLTFTAYAIQQEGFNDSEKLDSENAAAAWKAIEEQSK